MHVSASKIAMAMQLEAYCCIEWIKTERDLLQNIEVHTRNQFEFKKKEKKKKKKKKKRW